jgi:hypothetical protein
MRRAAGSGNMYANINAGLSALAPETNPINSYFQANPDVKAAYYSSSSPLSQAEFARQHFSQSGQTEGRADPGSYGDELFGARNRQGQLANLQQTYGSMLQGQRSAMDQQKGILSSSSLPGDVSGYSGQDKAELYRGLARQGLTDTQIRSAAEARYGMQTDANWQALQNAVADRTLYTDRPGGTVGGGAGNMTMGGGTPPPYSMGQGGSSLPPGIGGGASTPVPGQYGAIARPGYQQTPYTGAREGTKLDDGRILTAQGIYNPKTGYVITPDGYQIGAGSGVIAANKDILSAEDAEPMKGLTFSMDPNKDAAPEEVKNFIQWQMTQANPFGQGTLADLYAKQGITDPYNNPLVQQRAQGQLKQQDRRDAMYSATQMGLDPTLAHSPQGYGMWEDPNWMAKQTARAAATAQRGQQQAAAAPNVTVGGGIAGAAPAPQPAASAPVADDYRQQQYNSINQFLATNPSQEALSSAMQQYGVDQAMLDAAKAQGAGFAAGGIAALAQGGYPRRNGQISGPGTEKSDSIPAMLSDGEFVMTAKAVRGAGKGSRRAGAKQMYKLMHQLEKNAERG